MAGPPGANVWPLTRYTNPETIGEYSFVPRVMMGGVAGTVVGSAFCNAS
jgi:hypothetical protein